MCKRCAASQNVITKLERQSLPLGRICNILLSADHHPAAGQEILLFFLSGKLLGIYCLNTSFKPIQKWLYSSYNNSTITNVPREKNQ
jgi:hypothetical protein